MNASPAAAGSGSGPRPAARVAGFEPSVFSVYAQLAHEHEAIDLGQGYPSDGPPGFVRDALREASKGPQQYAPMRGLPALRREIAFDHGRWTGNELDPDRHVLVTVGATEALFAAFQAVLDPGDEAIVFEPWYDAYPAQIRMAGGVPVPVPLVRGRDGRWTVDPDRLEAAIGPRTRAIVVTNPHNPSGTVLREEEADLLVRAAERAGAVLVADEVYEHLSFGGPLRLATRPGAWERTLSISSFGKSFSATGWKVGWTIGPEELIHGLAMAHQWIPFAVATPLQVAAAEALRRAREQNDRYYRELRAEFARRADALIAALEGGPLHAVRPDGGYFVLADASALPYQDDVAACRDLPARAGVGAIPPSAFYAPERRHLAAHHLRLAFCRPAHELAEAGRRLSDAFADRRPPRPPKEHRPT